MRRISFTAEQAHAIGAVLSSKRAKLGLTIREVAMRSGVQKATLSLLERGEIRAPQPDTIVDLARTLGLRASDLFALAGWIPAAELPSLRPYLRAKYADLDDAAIADLARYAEDLAARHGNHGPIDREDERS